MTPIFSYIMCSYEIWAKPISDNKLNLCKIVIKEIAVRLDPMPQDGLSLAARQLERWGEEFL